jgi:opacity protein-like surface antigen
MGTYAHRVFGVPFVSVYVEVPVARTFDVGLSALQGNYTATFVVPGVKLKLAPEFPVSPYFFAGVGVAHFSANGTLAGSTVDRSSTSAAVDFGGGLDMKILPFVSIRGELRNVNSGGVGFALPIELGRQNNIMATGGLVFRF